MLKIKFLALFLSLTHKQTNKQQQQQQQQQQQENYNPVYFNIYCFGYQTRRQKILGRKVADNFGISFALRFFRCTSC